MFDGFLAVTTFALIFCLFAAIVSSFRRKGAKKYWIAVAVLFVLIGVTAPKSPESEQSNVADFSAPENENVKDGGMILEGGTATINAKGNSMYCFETADYLDAFIKASTDNDRYGVAQIISNHARLLQQGMKVRNIGNNGILSEVVHLRIESSALAGDDCWEPSDIKYFSNIKNPIYGQ